MKENRKPAAAIVVIVTSVIVVVLALSQLLGIWKDAIYVYEPLMGVSLLFQSILLWKKNRKLAVFQLVVAVLVLCAAVYILAIK